MLKTSVAISSTSDEAARIEGALKLGVEPDDVAVEPIDNDTYNVSMVNAPGQFDIVILERKMVATLQIITPPLGNGKPVANHSAIVQYFYNAITIALTLLVGGRQVDL